MTELLPPFTAEGVLPAGDYALRLDELCRTSLVLVEQQDNWDSPWRQTLVDNLATLINQLWQVGIDRIFIDGSFVEAKAHPNDIDGYFECDKSNLRDCKEITCTFGCPIAPHL